MNMTAVNVSTRSDQSTVNVPESIQVKSLTTTSLAFSGPKPMRTKTKIDSAAAISSAAQVTICAARSPMTRQNRPAIAAASMGSRTISLMARSMMRSAPLALHRADVFDLDGAAIAEIHHQDGEPDRRLGRGDGQHEHGEDLAHDVALEDREGHEVDVDGEQHQLDAHQDDDDVLAVQEDAQDAKGEQHRGEAEIVTEADGHDTPSPVGTFTVVTTWSL